MSATASVVRPGSTPAREAHPLAATAAFARRHWLGLALALVLAGIIVTPRWWLLATSPPEGVRIEVSPWGASDIGYDLALFAPTIRDVYDGSAGLAEFYDPTRLDVPTPPGVPWLVAIGLLGRVTGGPFAAAALVTTFAAIAAFLLLYAFALELTGERRLAAALLPVIALAVGMFVQAEGILPLRHWDVLRPVITIDPQREFHPWYRFVPPAIPLPIFLGCVIAIPRAVETGRRRWVALAALSLALLVYTYLFYWIALAGALAVWCAWLLYRRDLRTLRRLVVIGVIAAALAAPELAARVYDAFTLSADAQARFGRQPFGIDSGQFAAVGQRSLIGLPFLYPLLRGPERHRFYIALFAVPLALDVVTGIAPQPEHYVTQVWHVFALPAFIAGTADLVRLAPRRALRPARWAVAVVAVGGLVYLGVFQLRATRQVQASFAMPSDEQAAFDWLDAHAAGATIVSPSMSTGLLLAALTRSERYFEDGSFTRVSDDELVDRFLRAQAAFGYSEDDVFRRLDPVNGFPTADRSVPQPLLERHLEDFAAYFLFNWQITHPARISKRISEWRRRYEALLAERDVLRPYPADYLFCGHRERYWASASPSPGTYVTVAFQQGEATVYRLADASDPQARPFGGCS